MRTEATVIKMLHFRPNLTCCHPRPSSQYTYSRFHDSFIVCAELEMQGWSLCTQNIFTLHLRPGSVWTWHNFSVRRQNCSSRPHALKFLLWKPSPPNLTKRNGKKHLILSNGSVFNRPVKRHSTIVFKCFWFCSRPQQLFVQLWDFTIRYLEGDIISILIFKNQKIPLHDIVIVKTTLPLLCAVKF